MSYLFVMVIGALSGWVAGQYLKGSEMGIAPDVIAGAVGAAAAVLLSRMVGPEGVAGLVVSAAVAAAGAIASVYALRHALKEAPVKATRPRRR